jgi:RNA polymerase sigma-70 factor (ECF subfamily)
MVSISILFGLDTDVSRRELVVTVIRSELPQFTAMLNRFIEIVSGLPRIVTLESPSRGNFYRIVIIGLCVIICNNIGVLMDEGHDKTASRDKIPSVAVSPEESRLIESLRAGDEAAFVSLVEQYHEALVRQAMVYVSARGIAEEVVQETWIGVLRGIHGFEARSSLKTWIFRILMNRAKMRAIHEGRYVAFSSLDGDEPAVDADRFEPADDPQWANWWKDYPQNWDEIPEGKLLSDETRQQIEQAIEALPTNQREVITLRDVQGLTCDEVCQLLEISRENQRVLLHRARSKVRRALELYLGE